MIELGDKIRDRVSGLEGIATGVNQYLNGCVQWLISGPAKVPDATGAREHITARWFDVQQCELLNKNPLGISIPALWRPEPVGGPSGAPEPPNGSA